MKSVLWDEIELIPTYKPDETPILEELFMENTCRPLEDKGLQPGPVPFKEYITFCDCHTCNGFKMTEYLETRGWVTIQCSALGGDAITVVIDSRITGYPKGYPVYTEQELIDLCSAGSDDVIRLIHTAKKEGARIEGVAVK